MEFEIDTNATESVTNIPVLPSLLYEKFINNAVPRKGCLLSRSPVNSRTGLPEEKGKSGKPYPVRKLIYVYLYGQYPVDREIIMLCNEPKCINPHHMVVPLRELEAGSDGEKRKSRMRAVPPSVNAQIRADFHQRMPQLTGDPEELGLRKRKYTIEQLCLKYNLSRTAIYTALHEDPIDAGFVPREDRILTPQRIDDIVYKYYVAKLSAKDLALEYVVTVGTIVKILRANKRKGQEMLEKIAQEESEKEKQNVEA